MVIINNKKKLTLLYLLLSTFFKVKIVDKFSGLFSIKMAQILNTLVGFILAYLKILIT